MIEDLGRYHKIAISNHRITNIDRKSRRVTFTAKDYRRAGKNASDLVEPRICPALWPACFTQGFYQDTALWYFEQQLEK